MAKVLIFEESSYVDLKRVGYKLTVLYIVVTIFVSKHIV